MAMTKRKPPVRKRAESSRPNRFWFDLFSGAAVLGVLVAGMTAYTTVRRIDAGDFDTPRSQVERQAKPVAQPATKPVSHSTKSTPRLLRELAHLIAGKEDGDVFYGLLMTENGGSLKATRSSAGAIGSTQLMPITAKEMKCNRYDIEDNLRCGYGYYKKLKAQFRHPELALLAYNWGQGNVRALLAGRKSWEDVPKEAREYPGKVLKHAAKAARMAETQLAFN